MKRTLLLLLLFVASEQLSGATKYANSSTGSDTTGTGASGSPWKTFQKGLDNVAAGDTLDLVGTFAPGSTKTNGTSDLRITIEGHGTAVITGTSGRFTVQNSNYVVQNLIVRGIDTDGTGSYTNNTANAHDCYDYVTARGLPNQFPTHGPGCGMTLLGPAANNNTIINCFFSHAGSAAGGLIKFDDNGVAGDPSGPGPYNNLVKNCDFSFPHTDGMIILTGHDNTIDLCRFHDNDTWDVFRIWGVRNIVRNCFFDSVHNNACVPGPDNHTDIFQSFQTSTKRYFKDCIVERCTFVDNGGQIGMFEQYLVAPPSQFSNFTFRNNLLVRCRLKWDFQMDGVHIYNNTFYKSNVNDQNIGFYGKNSSCYNNLFIEVGDGSSNTAGFYGVSNSANPGGDTPLASFSADYNVISSAAATTTLSTPYEGYLNGVSGTAHGFYNNKPGGGHITGADVFVSVTPSPAPQTQRSGQYGPAPAYDITGVPFTLKGGTGDMRLKAGAFPIGAGKDLSAEGFSDDHDGNVRGGTWDIGAYEANAAPTPTPTATPGGTAPAFTSPTIANFTQGVDESFLVTASGIPAPLITLTSGTSPTGLSFTSGTGSATLGGPSTQNGNFTLTLKASNGVLPDASQTLVVKVAVPSSLPTPTPATLKFSP